MVLHSFYTKYTFLHVIISSHIQYYAAFWLVHLEYVLKNQNLEEADNLYVINFFDTHTLHWIECMALLGKLKDAVYLLRQIELSLTVI